MEELHRDSLGDLQRRDAGTLASWASAASLEGKDVVDVNGLRLGRITRSFAEEGAIVRLDLTLSENAARLLEADARTAAIPPHWIAGVEGEDVRLLKAGEQVVRPEDPAPKGAEADRGAKGLPRKER